MIDTIQNPTLLEIQVWWGFHANILQNHTRMMHSVKVQQTFNLSPFSANALSILITNLPPISQKNNPSL